MIRKFILTFIGTITILCSSGVAYAFDVVNPELCSGGGADSSVCNDKKTTGSEDPIAGPNGILTTITNIISILVGIAAVIAIVAGGLKLITSGSNPQEVTRGREIILYAIVALIIVVLAQALVRFFLNKVFG